MKTYLYDSYHHELMSQQQAFPCPGWWVLPCWEVLPIWIPEGKMTWECKWNHWNHKDNEKRQGGEEEPDGTTSDPTLVALERMQHQALFGDRSHPHKVGDFVRVTRNDEYFGRVGVIISPHGTKYWNVRLQPYENKPPRIIQKTPKYLDILDWAVFL